VDWATPVGTEIRSAGAGVVTFAGTVASNRTVTIHHGGGLRTSYSYLSSLRVEQGDRVGPTTVLGSSGDGHGTSVLHFSVRIGDTYVDPLLFLNCTKKDPSRALRLVAARETR
jgi:murein DD-endopeptidase MepM/ murein hydrolase activator NlpD